MDILTFLETINTINAFTKIFLKDKKIEELQQSIIENRLKSVLESTIELCIYRFDGSLTQEMIKNIIDNEKLLDKINNSLYSNELELSSGILDGYGLDSDIKKQFVEYFQQALKTAMFRDLEIRKIFRESKIYTEVDEIYDMTSIIYNRTDDILTVLSELKEMNKALVKRNEIYLKFYKESTNELTDTIGKITTKSFIKPGKILELENEAKTLVEKIKGFKIEDVSDKTESLENITYLKNIDKNILLEISNKFNNSCEYKNEHKKEIINNIKEFLDLEIENEEEFFDVGNLNRTIGIDGYDLNGTEEEKEKYKYLEALSEIINRLSIYIKYIINKFSEVYNVVPLCIYNRGEINNKNITIEINFNNVDSILDETNKNLVNISQIMDVDEYRIIDEILEQNYVKDIKKFPRSDYWDYYYFLNQMSLINPEDEMNSYKEKLKHLFNMKKTISAECITLTYELENIRPNEKIFLPTYILVESKHSFDISYNIVSENRIDNKFQSLKYTI